MRISDWSSDVCSSDLEAKAAAEAKVKAQAKKAEAEAKAKAKAEAEEKAKNPARVWVQIATGQDLKALAFDMGKLRKKYPDLPKGTDAWTSDWGSTRRLVIGPFASESPATSLNGEWKKAGGDERGSGSGRGKVWQNE